MRSAIRTSGLSIQHIPPTSSGAAEGTPAFVIVPDNFALRASYANADADDDDDIGGGAGIEVVTLEQLKVVLATGKVGKR